MKNLFIFVYNLFRVLVNFDVISCLFLVFLFFDLEFKEENNLNFIYYFFVLNYYVN